MRERHPLCIAASKPCGRGRQVAFATALAALVVGCGGSAVTSPAGPTETPLPSAVARADEFDGPEGSLPDPTRWAFDIGNNNGWGNRELQVYTSLAENVHLDGKGHLVIRALASDGGYTSARLKSQGLWTAQHGRIEARIRLPIGRGLWPAFWLLGNTYDGSNWPQCGEIDVMEYKGSEPSTVHGTVHGPQYSGGAGITATYVLPSRDRFSDDFHTFAVEWLPGSLTFSVDGVAYHTVTRASLPAVAVWVFNQPFFVLLNLAVGGNFPGLPDATTNFPQEMLVDYVRYTP